MALSNGETAGLDNIITIIVYHGVVCNILMLCKYLTESRRIFINYQSRTNDFLLCFVQRLNWTSHRELFDRSKAVWRQPSGYACSIDIRGKNPKLVDSTPNRVIQVIKNGDSHISCSKIDVM